MAKITYGENDALQKLDTSMQIKTQLRFTKTIGPGIARERANAQADRDSSRLLPLRPVGAV
jgi:hypothetical protein